VKRNLLSGPATTSDSISVCWIGVIAKKDRIVMSKATEQLKPQLDRLSAKERQELVEYLTNAKKKTARKSIDEKLLAVLEKRLDEIRSGKEQGISEEDFLAELREEFP